MNMNTDVLEESEMEEQEEYTAIFRKSRKKHRRRKQEAFTKGAKRTTDATNLSPFIVGTKPNTGTFERGTRDKNYKEDINKLVRDTIGQIGENIFTSKEVLSEKKGGFFLGECAYEEDLSVLQTVKIWKCKKTGKRGLDKFRRIVEFITFTKKMFDWKTTTKLTQQETIMFFLDTQTIEKQQNESKPLFDVTPFKSIGQKSFVNSVKDVLQKSPTKRTEKDVSALLHVLRSFSKFSSYPRHIQQGLCRTGWYSRFDSSRVIAREGNRADFYYLILSGVAVSRCLGNAIDPDERRRQLAEFHRQGDIIGEKEILTHSPRGATYVSKEPLEVLGLDRDIFLDIFKSSGGTECINFLRSIPDLQDFPLELLQTHYFNCSTHFYKRGAVIVKNSNDAEWVYVIKSGSCQAFKAVRSSENQEHAPDKRQHTSLLPSLKSARKDSTQSKSSEESRPTPRRAKSINKKKVTKTQLPTINKAKNSLVTQNYQHDGSNRTETPKNTTKKSSNKKDISHPIESPPTYYAKIDIVTERECFGLQSLVFDDNPNLSLVSNGAECVLISKQFLREHMDTEIKQRLESKLAPYPNLSQIQNAVDEKLAWETYRGKILHDTIR